MKELSLHILDIAENSIKADASKVVINIVEDTFENIFLIKIKDDGSGIKKEILEHIDDPFITTRKTRSIGMGIPLFKAAAKRCNGSLKVKSDSNGTKLVAKFEHDHIDRAPLGNIKDTIITLILWETDIDIVYRHQFNDDKFVFDTKEIKKELKDLNIKNKEITLWIKEYIKENIFKIRGGEI